MKRKLNAAMAAILAVLFFLGMLAPLASASETGAYRAVLNDYGIHAEAAWDAGLTGKGVTVAVIDSGLNAGNVFGPQTIVAGRHFYWREAENGRYLFPDGGQYDYFSDNDTTDQVGHGTMMAGVIADIAPGAAIMPIRCFDATTGNQWGSNSLVISAIDYAVEHGADVINLSVGQYQSSGSLHGAVKRAVDAGCIVIAATGNEGTTTIRYPAAFDGVVSVGATNKAGELSTFSNCNGSTSVCALGEDVRSTGWTNSHALATGTGTSFSTAIVSGGVALVKEAYPEMTPGELMALLEQNCDLVAASEGAAPRDAGAGALNVERLLQGAKLRRQLGCARCAQMVRQCVEAFMKKRGDTE